MKEFSQELENDRRFEIGGEVLEWEYPKWRQLGAIFDEDLKAMRNGDEVGDTSTIQALEQTVERIGMFLMEESRPRWAAIAERDENPVPLFQITDLYRWLLEVSSGRPTQSPSASEPGAGETEASSPAE